MIKALYIDINVPELEIVKQHVISDTTIVSKLEDLLTLEGIKLIGLMYDNDQYTSIPFMKYVKHDKKETKYTWYSQGFIDFLIKLQQKGVEQVDLITCSMNDKKFIEETKLLSEKLKLKIEYSLNQTGSTSESDWILESNNENLIGVFFTETINNWKHKLYTWSLTDRTDILNFFNDPTVVEIIGKDVDHVLTYNQSRKTYKLHTDIRIIVPVGNTPVHSILIREGETFDGDNHKVTMTYNTSGFFKFNSVTMNSTVKNLKWTSELSSTNIAGGLIRSDQRYFKVKNCRVKTLNSMSGSGGICGEDCSFFKISHCKNRSKLSEIPQEGGGICGAYCSNFTIKDCRNYSPFDTIGSGYCGGIVGYSCNTGKIIDCENYRDVTGYGSGGIIGPYFDTDYVGSSGSLIKDCTNHGDILEEYCGGICGVGFCDTYIEYFERINKYLITIEECKNYGKIGENATSSGGIIAGESIYVEFSLNDTPSTVITLDCGVTVIFKDCYTKYGSFCGDEFLESSFSSSNTIYKGPSVSFINCYTGQKVPLIPPINETLSTDVYWIKVKDEKEKKRVDLLTNPNFIAKK